MAVIYALDTHQARVYARLGKPHVSLPNIILGREAVPELVATPLEPDAVASMAMGLIGKKEARQKQVDAFGELSDLMETGEAAYGRKDPAERVLAIWRNQRLLIGS
jgi:lipid-A-disaccharide synthase